MSATGAPKKKHSLRILWTAAEECILIDIWEEKMEDLRGPRKNSHVYQEMAAKLQEAGFEGNWSDVLTKLDNLTRKYKEERKKIGPTGGAPSTWIYYPRIDNILGSFKVYNALETMHESTDMSSLLEETTTDSLIDFDPGAFCSSFLQSDSDCSQGPRTKKRGWMLMWSC